MTQFSQIFKMSSSIIKIKHSYNTRTSRSRSSSPYLQNLQTTSKIASRTANTFSTISTSSTTSNIQGKWVIKLSKKELTSEENSLLQNGQKFAVNLATIPFKVYISTITVAVLQTGDLNGVD